MVKHCYPCKDIAHAATIAETLAKPVKMGKAGGIWYVVTI